jgi:predicted GH43/DUF377 family glycosyl hydrolase
MYLHILNLISNYFVLSITLSVTHSFLLPFSTHHIIASIDIKECYKYSGLPIKRPLPWREEYGNHLRGGTPAILVRGVLLSFFHTQVNLHVFYSLNTYFMGAITFCPQPPFAISSISAYPILLPNLYEGNWVPKFLNYVVFPSGISLDEDGKHVHVSLGYQDMSAYVMRMELDTLLASLDFVADCNNSSSMR